MMTESTAPVWFMTGCSTGLGRALAQRIIQCGWRAVVTARSLAQVTDLAHSAEERVLPLTLDVTKLIATKQSSGSQAGDPVRAGDIMIALTQRPRAPRHIVLGAWGFDQVTQKMASRLEEIRRQKDLSISADFPNA